MLAMTLLVLVSGAASQLYVSLRLISGSAIPFGMALFLIGLIMGSRSPLS